MKLNATNIAAALAVIAGIIIGATGSGILACLGGIALAFTGAVTLINGNTDWIWSA